MEKILKEVVGYPGYFVSNYGEVYSTWKRGCPGSTYGGPLTRLKDINSEGRCYVTLSKDKKRKLSRIASIVLTAFVGPKPSGMIACHFPDRSTTNNRLDNLRWDTHTSNQHDRVAHGTTNDGERNGSAKLSLRDVKAILDLREAGLTYKSIALQFGVSTANIYMICSGRTWKRTA